MNELHIKEQRELAEELSGEWGADGFDLGALDLLDYLAIAGLKLKRVTVRDADVNGITSVGHAYFGLLEETRGLESEGPPA